LEHIKTLLKVDAAWIPEEAGYSIYIRPTVIGTQVSRKRQD
jgi:branched-chain amino acid aminotransferase